MKEEWKDIKDYEGLYQISNLGRVKSLVGWNGKKYISRERVLEPTKRSDDRATYQRAIVKLVKDGKGKDYRVHRLVAQAFIPNPEKKPQVNHIDGNPLNNNVKNLEWVTDRENKLHAIENDLRIYRINTIDRQTMVDFLNSGMEYKDIGKILGVSRATVCHYVKKFNIKKIFI